MKMKCISGLLFFFLSVMVRELFREFLITEEMRNRGVPVNKTAYQVVQANTSTSSSSSCINNNQLLVTGTKSA